MSYRLLYTKYKKKYLYTKAGSNNQQYPQFNDKKMQNMQEELDFNNIIEVLNKEDIETLINYLLLNNKLSEHKFADNNLLYDIYSIINDEDLSISDIFLNNKKNYENTFKKIFNKKEDKEFFTEYDLFTISKFENAIKYIKNKNDNLKRTRNSNTLEGTEISNKVQKIDGSILIGETSLNLEKMKPDGNCFFEAIKTAMNDTNITIKSLRTLVSNNYTEEAFNYIKEFLTNSENKNIYLKWIKNNYLTTNETDNALQYSIYLVTVGLENNNLNDLKTLDNDLDKLNYKNFQEHIITNSFWADDVAINIIEKEYNIKCIIFDNGDYSIKVRCSTNTPIEQDSTNLKFVKFILLLYNGSHYDLLSYNKIFQFSFDNLPKDIKIKVKKDCGSDQNLNYGIEFLDFFL